MADKDKLKRSALTYAKMGWHIFPVEPMGKKPLTPKGFHDASIDPGQINKWWDRWPNANIGLACKKSGIVAIDIDQDEDRGLYGLETWARLANENNIDDNSITSITGRGGHHILYKAKNSPDFQPSGRLGDGIDIQVKWNGYIILPPSIHPNGREYAWEITHRPDEIDILPIPRTLLDLLTKEDVSKPYRTNPSSISVGERNDYLTSVAGYWQSKGIHDDDLHELLIARNAKLSEPLEKDEVMSIFKSIIKYPKGHELPSALTELHFSEFGNADRFVHRFGENARFCYDRGLWAVWNGHRWEFDNGGAITRMGKKIIKNLIHEVNLGNIKEMAKHVKATETERQLNAMLNLARDSVPIKITDFDCDPWLMNTRQGYIDLRTGMLHPPDRLKYMSLCIGTDYDPVSKCPRWDQFIDEIFESNKPLISFVQRLLGYSLTGIKIEHVFPLLIGEGRNGKSTLLNTVLNIMGDYATTTPPETLLRKKDTGIPNDLAALYGKRFLWASETNTGQVLNEAAIKKLASDEPISARFMRSEWFTFNPVAKVWLGTNREPRIKDSSDAIWQRIKKIPFRVQFILKKGEAESELRKFPDKNLDAELRKEYPGILNWLIHGCLDWQHYGFDEPNEVISATRDYRENQNIVSSFIADCCEQDPTAPVFAQALNSAFQKWCRDNGEHGMTANFLGKELERLGYHRKRETNGKKLTYYMGLRLIEMAKQEVVPWEG